MFKEHLHHVADLNRQPKTPGHTATYGITEFADWSDDEFEARLGLVRDAKAMPANLTSVGPPGGQCTSTDATPKHTCQQTWNDTSFNNASVDKAWDWRGVPNVITPVKNQASCGGCWVRVAGRSVAPPWGSSRFRLALRTYDAPPCGPSVRVVSQTKSRNIPTRKTLPLFV